MDAAIREQVTEELRQLCSQYRAEVPSRRRTWPKSIKKRVLQLFELELSCEDVSVLSGISAATLYSWKSAAQKESAAFLPVQVIDKVPEAVPARREVRPRARRRGRAQMTPTIIVITPNGLRIEGLDVKSALEIALRLGAPS